MKRLTKDQIENRDEELDWDIAQLYFHANSKKIWHDFTPTTSWNDAGPLIEKHKVDIRYFDPTLNPDLESPWMAGIQRVSPTTKILKYYTAFGETPLIAAMRVLVKSANGQN